MSQPELPVAPAAIAPPAAPPAVAAEEVAEPPTPAGEVKLREEMRSLIWQRWLAVAAAVAAVIAYVFDHRHEIVALFSHRRPAVILVTTDDPFLRAHGVVQAACSSSVATESLRTSARLTVPPGRCEVQVSTGATVAAWKTEVVARVGETTTVRVPDVLMLQIRVTVDGLPDHVMRGDPLTFAVTSSARGYLWIYTEDSDKEAASARCTLLFPVHQADGASYEEHGIESNAPRSFPTPAARFFAGASRGPETLHMVVTSSDSEQVALGAIALRCGQIKAARASENVGAASVTYEVQ